MHVVVHYDCGGIGDSLLLVPALRLLRRSHPEARIGVGCHPGVGEWLRYAGLADEVYESQRPPPHCDVLLGVSNRSRAWRRENRGRARTIAATHNLGPAGVHQGMHQENVVRAALPVWEPYDDSPLEIEPDDRYRGAIILAPGSSNPPKNWPHFQQLCDWLCLRGYPVVTLEQNVPLRAPGAIRGDLITVSRAMAAAALVISNDSMAGHLAAFSGARVLSLFGPTQPEHWRPLGPNVTILRGCPQLQKFRPTGGVILCYENDCFDLLPVERVLDAVLSLLLSLLPSLP